MKRELMAVGLALVMAGCATKYGEMGLTGGVAAEPIMPNVYRIKARGNGYTDRAKVQDFTLLKAAETTVENGGTHFLIGGASDASRTSAFTTPGTVQLNRVGNTTFGTYTPGDTDIIVKPGQDTIITIVKVPAGTTPPAGALEARPIIETIGPRLKEK